MKKTFIFAAAAALSIFASCQKEEIEAPSTDSNGDLVFTATIDVQDSKTTIDAASGKVAWVIGDTITIDDANGKYAKYSVTSMEGDTLAIFTKVKGEPKLGVGPYTAVYGTSPAEKQTYSTTVPALRMGASSETTRLKFTVVVGLLELSLNAGESVTSIEVTGTPTGKTSPATFTLNCPEPVDIAECDTFFIALPAGTYTEFKIYGQNGAECTKSGSGVDIKANHITPVYFSKPLHFMVQLWADGPYFATTNIGASKPEDYGQYFAWGHKEGQTPSGTKFSTAFNTTNYPDVTTSPLDTTNDMASKNWGKGWSVPTDDDFKALISADSNKCSVTYVTDGVNGIKVAGKGNYASHSIFLPVAGYGSGSSLSNAGDIGYYWSSVKYDSDGACACKLSFIPGSGVKVVSYDNKYYGFSVRPVYRTAPDPKPAVPVFSVSAEKKVQFTKGNLYWNGSESEWHLEASQTAYPSSWDADHVGHFFWTNKTDYQSGTAEYMPYAKVYAYGNGENDDRRTASDEFFFGKGNNITVDGQSGLYALSNKEWGYLLTSETIGGRGDGDSKFKIGVTVCGAANCLVIAPDGYEGTIAATYTAETWATAEAEGLVCLPAAGNRAGLDVGIPETGYYWTATPNGGIAAYGFSSSDTKLILNMGATRNNGYALRLVYDYKAE